MRLGLIGAAAAAAIVMAGCGGGGGSDGGTSAVNGNFVDAPVAGVEYSSGDFNGTTDDNGAYKCVAGSTISFSVAGVDLGTVACGSLTTPLTLAGGDEEAAANIAYLLQNLDDDHNPDNGIHIGFDTHSPDWNHEPFHIDFKRGEDVDAVLNELGVDVTIDPEEAKRHMMAGIEEWKASHQSAHKPSQETGSPDNPPVSVSENPGNGNWQCALTAEYKGFVYETKLNTEGELAAKNSNGFCIPVAENGLDVVEAYEKDEYIDFKDLHTGETFNGYVEYWYPEGKVHYHITSSIHGSADCTAKYRVEHPVVMPGEPYMSAYTSFDEKDYLIDPGNCPAWVLDDGEYDEEEEEYNTGTEIEHHVIKTSDGKTTTIDYYTKISKK